MSKPKVTARSIAIDHIKLECEKSFEDVRTTLVTILPQLDPAIPEMLRKGDRERTDWERAHGPKLWIFLARDHGILLQVAGAPRKAIQYEIGNPITAERMTRAAG